MYSRRNQIIAMPRCRLLIDGVALPPGMHTMSYDAICAYIRRGWAPTPLAPTSKCPVLSGWQTTRLTEGDIPKHWNNGQGVGLVLGLSGLVDIDLDHPLAVRLAPRFLPGTRMVGGHDGRPQSHWYYRCDEATHATYAAPGDGHPLVELRAGAHQTVVAPSRHPDGHTYRWYDVSGRRLTEPGEPARIRAEELRRAVGRLAAATLLAMIWPKGRRHETALALAGALRRAGWSLADAQALLGAVTIAAQDPESADRLRAVQATYERGEDEPTTGLARLKTLIGAGVVERVAAWLGLDRASDRWTQRPSSATPRLVPIPKYEPFPLDIMPGPWREFCRVGAELLNVDPAMTALPALAVLASAVGMTRQIRLGHDWFEPAVLWTCVVADSGSRKSGAAELSVKLVMDRQLKLSQQHKLELRDHAEELRRRKANREDATTLEAPVHQRLVVSDATLEKVITILDENPRGLLLYRDELRGWFGSFQKYRHAQAGSDEPAWLSMHGAKTLVYDRKTGVKTTVIVPHAAVSVTGTIQPAVLRTVVTEQAFGSGLVARVVFAQPPKRPKHYVEVGVPEGLRQQCAASLAKLYDMGAQEDDDEVLRPLTVILSKEAQARWKQFVNELGERQYLATGEEAAFLAKAEGLAGRFALIHHLVEAEPCEDLQPVRLRSIEAGIRFAEWAVAENLRVYRLVQEEKESAKLRELVELVQRLAERTGGTVGARDLMTYHKTRYPDKQTAILALELLANAGLGEWVEVEKSSIRGRTPEQRFRFTTATANTAEFPPSSDGGNGVTTAETNCRIPDGHKYTSTGNNVSNCGGLAYVEKCDGYPGISQYLQYCSNDRKAGIAKVDTNQPEGILQYNSAVTSFVTDPTQFGELRRHIETSTSVGIDLETTGLNPRRDRIRLISLFAGGRTYVVDCFQVDPTPLFDRLQTVELVGHNLLFDLQFLGQLGFVPTKAFDTLLASQVLTAGSGVKQALSDVAKRYLYVELDKTHQTADWSGPLTESMVQYAALDAVVPLKLREVMLPKLQAVKLEPVIDLENRCLLAVVSMSLNGVGFDADRWVQLADEAEQRRQELEAQMNALVPLGAHLFGPGECNWNSPEQVKTVYARLGVPLDSTADADLAGVNHPLAALMRKYRAVAKLAGTYGREWLRHVENGRVYPHWRQCATATGRMSCGNPNVQQLPRDPAYRRCFVAGPGNVLVKADYSQIELRLAAKIAGEERMIAAYQRGEDLHTKTAQAILGKTEVSKADRQLAKAINFGLLYGMGYRTFAQYAKLNYGVALTEEEAKRYRDKFFETYPGLKRWHRRQAGSTAGKPIATRTLLGRHRLEVSRYTEKLNTPVQGSGADGLKAALALLWERRDECPSAKLVLAVHDEIVIEVPEAEAEPAKAWLIRCMEDGMRPLLDPVPVAVEATIAPTWGG